MAASGAPDATRQYMAWFKYPYDCCSLLQKHEEVQAFATLRIYLDNTHKFCMRSIDSACRLMAIGGHAHPLG